MQLAILSGGAAQGLVEALRDRFKAETGCEIAGTFGAVGAMRDKLIGGAPADLLILTSALIGELAGAGHVVTGSAVDLGIVRTAIAVRAGDPVPPVGDADSFARGAAGSRRDPLSRHEARHRRHPLRQSACGPRHCG